MKILRSTMTSLFLAVILTSCNSLISPPSTSPTVVIETAIASVWTAVVETQSAVPTITSISLLPTSLPIKEPESTPILSIAEEETFWENLDSIPPNVSINEYALPPGINPTQDDGLFQFLPAKTRETGEIIPSPTPHQTTLEELGYEIRTVYTAEGLPYDQQLYKDKRLLFDRVTHLLGIYTFLTEEDPIIAFIVEIDTESGRQSYLIQNDVITFYGRYAIHEFAPVLYQGELLWARTYTDHTEVKKSNGDVILTVPSNWMHRPSFFAWNGHWILEAKDTVVVDREIINEQFGFKEVFNWGLVKDKPTYFFRKGARIGLSHDGQLIPIQYQNVAHNLCCSPAQNNPSMVNNVVQFFGERDNIWYYVEIEFK